MKTFKYARVSPQYIVEFFSTDPQVVEWILSELKKVIPSYSLKRKTLDFSGKVIDCALEKLQDKDYEVGLWIIQQLCQNGWEPFAVHAEGEYSNKTVCHFRLEIEAEIKNN